MIALTGCGSGDRRVSHARYAHTLETTIEHLDRVILVRARGRATPVAIRSLARAVDAGAARLDGLRPPREAESGNDELVCALHAYALDLRDFALELRLSPAARREAALRLAHSAAMRAIQRAEADLARAGYPLQI